MEMSFPILIQFSFSETITETFPHFENLYGFKTHELSMIWVTFSAWALWLRMFSVFIHVLTCIISASFIFFIVIKSNIYHLNHFEYTVLWHWLHSHCRTNILTIRLLDRFIFPMGNSVSMSLHFCQNLLFLILLIIGLLVFVEGYGVVVLMCISIVTNDV